MLSFQLQALITTAFDDLENDDDVSSVDSSHYQDDSIRDTDCTNTIVNSGLESVTPAKGQVAVMQKEFDVVYNRMENLNNYDDDIITNHISDSETGGTVQADFDLYRQTGTPYVNNKFNDNSNSNSMLETPYELSKPPTGYSRKMHPQSVKEATFGENYPYNYETPANHYNTHIIKKYSNNGFIDVHENNVQSKQIQEFGGGDNATSDHMNHCYKTSPNGRSIDDDAAYITAEYNSREQLEVLYKVRLREIDRLTDELQQLQSEKEDEKNQMTKKLMLLQAEIDKINISRTQAQRALGKDERSYIIIWSLEQKMLVLIISINDIIKYI